MRTEQTVEPIKQKIRVVEVIETALTERVSQLGDNAIVRTVTQYWDRDGNLLAEKDPIDDTLAHLSSDQNVQCQINELRAQNIIFRDAIKWALGECGSFPTRPHNKGQLWWRTELRKRAGL